MSGWGKRGSLLNDVVRADSIEKKEGRVTKQPSGRKTFNTEEAVSVKTPGWEWCVYHILATSRMPEWLRRSKLRGK